MNFLKHWDNLSFISYHQPLAFSLAPGTKIQIPIFTNGLLTPILKKKKKKKKKNFLPTVISDGEREVITRMATFKGEHTLENRAA